MVEESGFKLKNSDSRKKSRSPDRKRRERASTDKDHRKRSRSPDHKRRKKDSKDKDRQKKSRSPDHKRRKRDSVDKNHRKRSHSPDHKRRERDSKDKDRQNKSPSPERKRRKKAKSKSKKPKLDLESVAAADDEMLKQMGFGGFDSTKGKKVEGNVTGMAKVNKPSKYRQYMNRKGGFNRPLDYVA